MAGPPEAFLRIEPATFWMGSPADEPGRAEDEARHRVRLTRPFLVKATEVTRAEWSAVAPGATSSDTADCGDDCPMDGVTWYDAAAYCNALSTTAGLAPCYALQDCHPTDDVGRDCAGATFAGLDCMGYRLPTEAEWEFAARAGTDTAFHAGALTHPGDTPVDPILDLVGWYAGNANARPHPVGRMEPNAWGLYDMHGDACEWTHDAYAADAGGVFDPEIAVVDPVGPALGVQRICRGGSWAQPARRARSAARTPRPPADGSREVGFRPVRTVRP